MDKDFSVLTFSKNIQSGDKCEDIFKDWSKSEIKNFAEKKDLLHIAVELNNIDAVKYFIELGIDVNRIDKCGRGKTILYSKSPDILQLLISKGADINDVDCFNNCLLENLLLDHDYDFFKIVLQLPNVNIEPLKIRFNLSNVSPSLLYIEIIKKIKASRHSEEYDDFDDYESIDSESDVV